jgi:hypothetical protein
MSVSSRRKVFHLQLNYSLVHVVRHRRKGIGDPMDTDAQSRNSPMTLACTAVPLVISAGPSTDLAQLFFIAGKKIRGIVDMRKARADAPHS